MKPDKNDNIDETTSQNELEKLLEQKQSETEALKRLIGVLEKMEIPDNRKKATE